jgi:LysM repeat protein
LPSFFLLIFYCILVSSAHNTRHQSKELVMCKAVTFNLVAVLMLVAGAIGCHRDNGENAANEGAPECKANEPTNVVENVPPATESTTGPTSSTAPAETGPAATETAATMDNSATRLPADNSAASNTPTPSDSGVTATAEKTYIIKSGDSLWTIAKEQYGDGSKHDLIAKANPGLNPNALKVGSKLIIPPLPPSETPGDSGTVVVHPGQTAGEAYTVQSGDTLWTIAEKHYGNGVKAKLIEQANPGLKGTLHIGQKITLPPDTTATTSESPTTSTSRPAHKKPVHKKPASDSPARPEFN